MTFFNQNKPRGNYKIDFLLPISSKKRHVGILLTLLAWLLIDLTSDTLKFNTVSISFYNRCFYQFLIAFMSLGIWYSFKGKPNIFSKNPIGITLNSIFAIACYIAFAFLRVSDLNLTNSIFINLDLFLLPLLCVFFFRQKISLLSWLGILITFLGLTCTNSFTLKLQNSHEVLQSLFSILTAFVFASLVLSTNYLIRNSNSPFVITLYNTLIGCFCFGCISALIGLEIPHLKDLPYLILSGVIYAIAVFMFTSAHRYTEAYLILALSFAEPIFQKMLRSIFGITSITSPSLINCIFIVFGLAVMILPTYLTKESLYKSLDAQLDSVA
ncbi:MAG: hypothetical protein S4CHLAM7_11160 [Chlamydiae bacterium]|nr:hypothetical protein [Chlamydiota bacterium]